MSQLKTPQIPTLPRHSSKYKHRRSDPKLAILAAGVIATLFLTIGLPTAKIFAAGISSNGISAFIGTFTPSSASSGGLFGGAFFNSIILGLLVGALGTFIGFVTAYAQVKLEFPGKKIVHWISLLPVISPPFAIATAIITLFGRRGIITHQIFGLDFDIYGLHGLVIVLTMTFAPVAYMNIRGMLTKLDPSLDEAAESLGHSGLGILFKVTIPMVLPALLASFLILFVEGLADLANPLVLGGNYQVLASQIYFAVAGEGNIAKAAGISISLLLPSLLVFLIQRYWAGRKSVITVTGKPTGKPRLVTAKSVKIPILLFMFGWVGLIALMYLSVFLGGFTQIFGVNNTFSLEHYHFVFNLGSSAIITTLWMTLLAAPVAAVLGVLIAWLVVRYFRRLAGILDLFGMLGSAIPGTVLGLGYALAYSVPTYFLGYQILPPLAGGTALGAGVIAIIMIYIARGNPTGQQGNIAALRQINPQIEEAAVSLGASQTTTIRKVTVPLLIPSLISATTFAITKSMTTITAIIFITTPQTKVMTAQILDEVDAGRLGNAFAYCTILILLVLVILAIAQIAIGYITRNFSSPKQI